MKKPSVMTHASIPSAGERDRWTPRAHWPPSVASLMSSEPIRDPVFKNKQWSRPWEYHLGLSYGLHTYTFHPYTHTYMLECIHTFVCMSLPLSWNLTPTECNLDLCSRLTWHLASVACSSPLSPRQWARILVIQVQPGCREFWVGLSTGDHSSRHPWSI